MRMMLHATPYAIVSVHCSCGWGARSRCQKLLAAGLVGVPWKLHLLGMANNYLLFLHDAKNHKYWIAVRHHTCYRSTTNNSKLTFLQKILMVSNPSSRVQLFCLAFFCSASTQTVLMCTVGTHRVQRSLVAYKYHAFVSYVQLTSRGTHSRG